MAISVIDGEIFHSMLKNGLRRLQLNEEYVDRLNVFPVPDGDTGKNMSKTLLGGVAAGEDKKSLGEMMTAFSRGSLLSARGNSGVILSQYIRGLASFVKGKTELDINELPELLAKGSATAYKAVRTPTEGTMLTVMRETAEWAADKSFPDFGEAFAELLPVMRASLAATPDKLPVLKEAGVVDSGGAGLLCIFEGMEAALRGDTEAEVELGVEFTCAVGDEAAASAPKKHKKFAVVSTAPGAGIAGYFIGIGADAIVDGGQTSNPSAEDFIKAFDTVDADYIVVLPNNSNIKLAAKQAAELYERTPVTVVPTSSVAEGYSALSMMDDSCEELAEFVSCMTSCLDGVTSLFLTTATRDAHMNGIDVVKDNYIALDGDRILHCSDNKLETFLSALEAVEGIADKQTLLAFWGRSMDEAEAESFSVALSEKFPNIEAGFIEGGQGVYDLIVSLE